MAVTSTLRPTQAGTGRSPIALAVADANWYTTENLFREVGRPEVSTLLLKCVDYYNAWQRGSPPWSWGQSLAQREARLWQRDLVLPSGWMKRFPHLGMRPIRRAIDDWRSRHAPEARLGLVMTYPHYLYLRDLVKPDFHVYFNIDDYSQYWPAFADRVNELERQAVLEADLTVCVSGVRCEELRAAVPGSAGRIRHLPHGAPPIALGDAPQVEPAPPPADIVHLPRPLLGYVGTLEDRIDWPLLETLARAYPAASVVLVGRTARSRSHRWHADARRCLALPNVHAVGWRPQEQIASYNRAFDVCLIPYRPDHPFNRVCCPTKIMDYMATGRPIVSTDVPECRLHAGRIRVVAGADGFLDAIAEQIANGPDPHGSHERFAWARDNSCARVVERFLDWLPS